MQKQQVKVRHITKCIGLLSRKKQLLLFVTFFATAGVAWLMISSAATNSVSVETSDGLAQNGAKPVADPNASGGALIVFESNAPPDNTKQCTLYVSPSGGGNGTSLNSPTTLGDVLNQTQPGSVVCLLGGTYTHTGNITNFRSGTESAWIMFRNYDANPPLIKYTGTKLSGGQFQLAGTNSWNGPHHIVFDGLHFDGGNQIGGAIFVKDGAHHITMRNLRIQNPGASGIALNATDYVVAENNHIHHGGYNQGWSSGISLWYGGDSPRYGGGNTNWYDSFAGFHNVIANNVISGWYDSGVDCIKYVSSCPTDGNGIIIDSAVQSVVSIPPVLISGNVVYQNGGRGIHNRGGDRNVWIINNTVYANGLDSRKTFPSMMAQKSASNYWVNNVVYGKSSSAYNFWNDNSTIIGKTNIYFNGANQAASNTWFIGGGATNPLFISPPAISGYSDAVAPWDLGNALMLQASSPAINAGTDPKTIEGITPELLQGLNTYLQKDVTGKNRYNGQIDIGAYEY